MARRPSIKAWFNYEKQNIEDAMYSIILIILVITLLLAFSASFNSAVETLVVIPLQARDALSRLSRPLLLT